MTSNQLNYWKLKEEERSNKERERETARSNRVNEDIKTIQNNLRENELALTEKLKELDIEQKRKEDVLKLSQLLSEYGYVNWSQLPEEARAEFYDYLGVEDPGTEPGDATPARVFKEVWNFIKEAANAVGQAAKGIGALF